LAILLAVTPSFLPKAFNADKLLLIEDIIVSPLIIFHYIYIGLNGDFL
jgi:hypothetical protein